MQDFREFKTVFLYLTLLDTALPIANAYYEISAGNGDEPMTIAQFKVVHSSSHCPH